MRRLVVISSLLVVADVLDITSTYLATPDLSKEWNPLVRGLGIGWEAIIVLHVVIIAVLLLGLLYHHRHALKPSDVPSDVMTNKQMFLWFMSGYHKEAPQIQLKLYIAFLGLVLPLGAAINGLCNTVLNLTYYFGYFGGLNEETVAVYNTIRLVVILLGVITVVFLILKKEYSKGIRS